MPHETRQEYRIKGFYRETQFQETPIGKIPRDWAINKFSNLFSYVKGKRPRFLSGDSCDNCLPYLTADYLRSGKPLQFAKVERDTIIVEEGDVLLIWDGSNAGEFFLGKKGILASTMVKIQPRKGDLLRSFMYYYAKYKFEQILKASTKGTGIPHIDNEVLNSLTMPIPPLKEQWGIAEVLSSVDNAIEAVERLIEKLERIKQGLMQELLTKGIGHKEFKETPIGKIPKEWQIAWLREIVEVRDKCRVPVKEQNRKPGPYPYCGANGIIDYVDGYTHDGEFVLLAEDGGFFGPFEKSAYVIRGKFWANNHVHVLKPLEGKIVSEFLMYYLNFADLRPFLTGSTRPKLTQSAMLQIPVPLPPLEEQRRIASILISIDDWIEVEKKRKELFERLKRGLMDLLLTGRVRVMVDG